MAQDTNRWADQISRWPIPEHVRVNILKYSNYLQEADLPVILEFSQLAHLLEVQPDVLADMANRTERFYREFTIPKRRRGSRVISVPSPTLIFVQRWIKDEILSRATPHDSAYGFITGRSIIDNASKHLGCRTLLKLDLKNFFPSIRINRVVSVFRRFGYAPNVSYYLSALCCLRGSLPQGAPSSPMLSNIIAKRLDARLKGFCDNHHLSYSRYADDLTISGEDITAEVVTAIRGIVAAEQFSINEDKVVIARGDSKKIVTGISVSGESLSVPRSYKRELRKQFHFVRKYGVFEHMERTNDGDPILLDRLIGKFQFWLQVEPESSFAKQAIEALKEEDNRVSGNFENW